VVPADERTAKVQEAFVVRGAAVIPQNEAPLSIEPHEGALDHPAMAAEALLRLDAPASDAMLDAARPARVPTPRKS
jgi:hypothetical protein